jgi:hypothetical protein
MIRSKSGEIKPLVFNAAQRHIHERIEAQRQSTGKVRALILKGRQQGCSTYVAARFYHRTTQTSGQRTFILSHEEAATTNLFEIVDRYQKNRPEHLRPSTGNANAKELYFDEFDSGYKVGTAGTKAVGRSSTIQLFHGSEVAFWPFADTHAAGILQAVPNEDETEIILESTANGIGNFFHQMWRDAEAGRNDYIAIFVPWFWTTEYRHASFETGASRPPQDEVFETGASQALQPFETGATRPPQDEAAGRVGVGSGPGLSGAPALVDTGQTLIAPLNSGYEVRRSEEEREYAALYGLDDAQLLWRRQKIAELKDEALFKQEYPGNAAEAFQLSGHDSFIPPALIARARKGEAPPSGPLIVGFDPAWMGEDRHAMAFRRGRRLIKVETKVRLDTMAAAGWLKRTIDAEKPARVFIDVGGVGAGVYDRLREWGEPYGGIVAPINFGSAPFEPPPLDERGEPTGGPANRRAEMWMRSKEWLEDAAGVQVPDSDTLHADACGPSYRYDSHTRLVLERKEDMRRRGVPSPDEWDAVALTFAEPVGPANFRRRIEYPDMGIA